ncbi:MAG: hypothetical protein FJ029_11250, partial [Actinobacteria bacterium]|nr:hypothetical protein [Actinomycetota bacterium]
MRGLFLISVASLLYELVLTRVYALAQGHHFAFMAIAAALLGIGASGTLASRSPRIRSAPPASVVAWCGAGVAATAGLAYVTADRFPFDAYRVGVDAWQLLWLAAYFLVAGVPFVFAGLATIVTLAADPARARLPYFINLVGAGLGALLAVAVVTVLAPAAGVAVAATIAALALPVAERRPRMRLAGLVLVGGLAALAGLTASTGPRLSPYADLSHLLRRPGAERVATYRSPGSQVDVVRGARQRSAPGLSLAFLGDVPLAAHTVTVDGSDSAVADAPLGDYLAYLPLAPLLQARPVASALVLAPVGGPEVGVLLAHGVRAVTVVQPDAAVVRAWEHAPPDAPLRDPRVRIEMRGVREALAGGSGYDLVLWPLRESFQGVAAGAFSLRETYAMTVEAYRDAWRALNPHGVLLLSRWTQAGPTEAVRAWATLRAALAEVRTPEEQLLAWRSLET